MSARFLSTDQTVDVAPTLTADGRFASFGQDTSLAGPLLRPNIFINETCAGASAGCVFRDLSISESDGGITANAASYNSTLAGDGSRAAFASDATNLVTGDANGRRDIFLARTGLSP
jgi:hypothetical protein